MISAGFSYKIKYCNHYVTKTGKNITSFTIGDKVKESNPTEYINYKCTVWQKIDIIDGQSFKIEKIVNLSADIYVGKNGPVKQYKLTLEGTPITGNEDFTPPQEEDAPKYRSNAVTDTGKAPEPFFPRMEGDDENGFVLPFDI